MRSLFHEIVFLCLTFLSVGKISTVIHEAKSGAKNFLENYKHPRLDFTIHKVSFTQKGYIQFLRYIAEVPPLNEYTFCLWVRSHNLTYSHPLLSYSKHEEERLIRVWISPHGTDINLEILGEEVFKIPVKFLENHWYHVCQSWSGHDASWRFYLNGKIKANGYKPELLGATIKSDGDIVVGQEYTDFDKGLDDGIEGDIFGFNFVLSSPTSPTVKNINYPLIARRRYDRIRFPRDRSSSLQTKEFIPLQFYPSSHRKSRGFIDNLSNMFDFFPVEEEEHRVKIHTIQRPPHHIESRVINDIGEYHPSRSIASKLVELSYNCVLGRGSPVSGPEVLISWTRTPVRVFGGAILKTIPPFCAQ